MCKVTWSTTIFKNSGRASVLGNSHERPLTLDSAHKLCTKLGFGGEHGGGGGDGK